MNFNVCVVGAGDMGRNHVAQWSKRADAHVVAVCDIDRPRAEKLATPLGAAVYEDYRQAIVQDGVNAVSVCVPVCLHSEIGGFAAAQGRHVLTEKPIALTRPQADELIAAARRNRVRLAVSYQMRALPRFEDCRARIRAGEFGAPIFARFVDIREVRPKVAMRRRSMNNGPLVDMAGHYFDLMRYLTDSEPQSVYARGHRFGLPHQSDVEADDYAIDAAEVLVQYGGGHVLSVFANWGMPTGYKSLGDEVICGPELSWRALGSKVTLHRPDRIEPLDLPEPRFAGPGARIDDFVAAIREGRDPEVSGAEGLAALRVCLAAVESIETGREIIL